MTTTYRTFGLLILFALLLSIYTMSSSGRFHIVDEVSIYAVTESVATRSKLDTNAIAWTQWVNSPGEVLGAFGQDGEVYSKKGPAPAFLALPWYHGVRLLSRIGVGLGILQTTLLWNGVVTAATAVLLFLTAVQFGYRNRTGLALGLLYGLATIAWPYANHFFGEPLSAFGLLAAFLSIYLWERTGRLAWMFLAGAGAAIMLVTVTAHALLIGVLGLYVLLLGLTPSAPRTGEAERRQGFPLVPLITFALPVLFAGGLLLLYNNVRFGNPLDTGYHFDSGEGFTNPFLSGFWGLMFSPYRGVFWHTPLLIGSLLAAPAFLRRHRREGYAIAALSVVLISLYSFWWMWWGGFAWGPRFLVPLTPLWVLVLAPYVQKYVNIVTRLPARRWIAALGVRGMSVVILALLSFLVQIGAVAQNYVNYEIVLRSLYPTDWADPLKYGPPNQSLRDLLLSPVFGQFRLMRENFIANTDLAWLWADGNVQLLVLMVGVLVIGTLIVALYLWWRTDERGENVAPSMPLRVLIALLPMVLISTWLGETGRNPAYGTADQGYRAIIRDICADARSTEDAVVTIAPFSYQIPMNWMPGLCVPMLPIYGYAKTNLDHPEADQVMAELLATRERIWFITEGLPVNDPDNDFERYLAEHAYKASDIWYNDFRLLRYATPRLMTEAAARRFSIPLTTRGGEVVTILTAQVPELVDPGGMLPLSIDYEVVTPQDSDLRWFVQLLDPAGFPLALLDSGPVDGYARFTELPVNQALSERFALQIPPTAAPGIYQLIAGLYDPLDQGAPRLITPNGSDFVEIGKIEVGE
ncbi:MAG: hypothetical protein H6642_08925 [Caldilineaceae bacterium]|nr:hypothetical protein [Caldilineaceae bacterium]